MKIRIGIAGYGNLGRGVESAVASSKDMELVGVFTRRDPSTVHTVTGLPVYGMDEAAGMQDKIDVMILCGGSANDLPEQTPALAASFNVVDSFDTHAKIPDHFDRVDQVCQKSGTIAVISAGWDPGLFSLNRLFGQAVLPQGEDYTFWGEGVSQGHSDAIRRIAGVKDARQYTIPVDSAVEQVRSGKNPTLTTRQKHKRDCYVVAEEQADLERIRQEIITMPNYFAEYDTTVHFISEEELRQNHSGIPHGGMVFRSGSTGFQGENHHVIEYRLQLDSNPEFTSSILVAYARAAHRLSQEGCKGCKTVLDVPPAYLHPESGEILRKMLV